MLKERFIRNILTDKSFEREGHFFTPEQKYNICLENLLLQSPQDNQPINGFSYGCLLDKSQEDVINYFANKKVIAKIPF